MLDDQQVPVALEIIAKNNLAAMDRLDLVAMQRFDLDAIVEGIGVETGALFFPKAEMMSPWSGQASLPRRDAKLTLSAASGPLF